MKRIEKETFDDIVVDRVRRSYRGVRGIWPRYEKIFSTDGRKTPAVAVNDGVDCVPMKTWKAFLIQLLNIAGTGPIFGALMGAVFGPVVFLWIVLGSILGGAFDNIRRRFDTAKKTFARRKRSDMI